MAISAKQVSFEKRKFLVKKLGYGRKDQVDKIVKSVKGEGNDKKPEISYNWDWEEQLEMERFEVEQLQEERMKEEIEQERLVFEVEHCLGLLRMFFLMGKKFVIA